MGTILDGFVQRYIDKLTEHIEERVAMAMGVKGELQRLQERLESVVDLLADAERQRLNDPAVDRWVAKLKDVMYDADDFVDVCRGVKREKLGKDHPSASCSNWALSVSGLFSSISSPSTSSCNSFDTGNRIKSLNEKLQEITEDQTVISKLSYGKITRMDGDIAGTVNPRKTSPLVDCDLVGTDVDVAAKMLSELLVKEDKINSQVLAIVGMGGIGKTTLAQKIFNDQKVMESFSGRIWLCVSQSFSETNLLKEILRNMGVNYGEATTKAELQPMLRAAIYGKSLLLVLDDVWQAEVWVDLLRNPLQGGAAQLRVLVTTRDFNVATRMKALHVHRVKELPASVGWELLCKKVFVFEAEEEVESLKEVGFRIVEKCHGLPLAIKVVSGLLTTKEKNKRDWERVLRNEAWSIRELPEELRGALYLSYEDLPSHLKQCFLYFALFPEDYKFDKFTITKLFVAEGFIRNEDGSSPKESAEEYVEELLRRCLLQPCPTIIGYGGVFTMHDLLHALAQFLSKNECYFGDAQKWKDNGTIKLRRLSMTGKGDLAVIPDHIVDQNFLRTLILLESPPRLEDKQIAKLSRLRVLVLNGPGIMSLPDAITALIHLRYLDLNGAMVQRLPESLGRLSNLQVLRLSRCKCLHTIPTAITQLCNLQCLDVGHTPLSHVPVGIGRLEQLNVLSGFIIGDDGGVAGTGCELEELRFLSQLGYLAINRMERATNVSSKIFASMPYLKTLYLVCISRRQAMNSANQWQFTEADCNRMQNNFDQLSPPPSLQKLTIDSFLGHGYPKWLVSLNLGASFPYLKSLYLLENELCSQLPPVGQLPQLRYMLLRGSIAMITVGHEILGAGVRGKNTSPVSTSFPKLEVWRIQDMLNWEEWVMSPGTMAARPMSLFPELQELHLTNCPKLKGLPDGLEMAKTLNLVAIDGLHRVRALEGLHCLELRIVSSLCLERISRLPAVKKLYIENCPALQNVENLDALEFLQLNDISMVRLPHWLLGLAHEQGHLRRSELVLVIECSSSVLQRCLMQEGPDWPIIEQYSSVSVYADTRGKRLHLKYVKENLFYETNFIAHK